MKNYKTGLSKCPSCEREYWPIFVNTKYPACKNCYADYLKFVSANRKSKLIDRDG